MNGIFFQKIKDFRETWTDLLAGKLKPARILEAQAIPLPAVAPKGESIMREPEKKETVKTAPSNVQRIQSPDPVEATVISKDTEINGSITNRTNIKITGIVKGNIISEASVIVCGAVKGDIVGESVTIQSGSVIGNITSKAAVAVSEKSTVEGDIKCDKFNLNGNVKGNVQVRSSATLGCVAVISGNLTSQYLSIQEGAMIDGAVKVTRNAEAPTENMLQQLGLKKPEFASLASLG